MTVATALLAHQGGWDEILILVGPVAVIGGALWLAKRRVDRAARSSAGPHADADDVTRS